MYNRLKKTTYESEDLKLWQDPEAEGTAEAVPAVHSEAAEAAADLAADPHTIITIFTEDFSGDPGSSSDRPYFSEADF